MHVFTFTGAVKADKPQFTWDEEVRVCILHSMLLNRDEERTVHGGIIIFDCSGMTLKHISRVKMDEMRKWNKAWQASYVHYIVYIFVID